MGLPIAFLAGLLVVFAARDLMAPVPGSGDVGTLLLHAAWLPLPFLLVVAALWRLRLWLVHGRRGGPHPRRLLHVSAALSPIAVFMVSGPGGWFDFVWQWSGDSHLGSFALLALPLLLTELPRLVLATKAQTWVEIADELGPHAAAPGSLPLLADVRGILRLRLGWPLLLMMPWALLGAGLDLLQLDRASYMFVVGTTMGSTLGTLVFLVLGAVVLPVWFRFAFGATALPEPIGSTLRRTAALLRFRPSRVLLLPTGMRALNAMLVGPLPIGRCLLVTDGLLRTLDDDLLAGVVAHEVGHAQRGHPALLMVIAVVVPLLLLAPLHLLELEQMSVLWQSIAGLLAVIFLWSMVRALAQRFELEADVASVQALGADPCSRALMAVASIAVPVTHSLFGRLLSLHPDERSRCTVMRRYELDPAFRAHFDATGRRLRTGIAALTGSAALLAALTWAIDWPRERVIWHLQCGDVAAAQQACAQLEGEVPERWRETWSQLREELDAAAAVAGASRDWQTAQPLFAEAGWRRGVEVLLRSGPAAARPWFALAAEGGGEDRVLRHVLHAYCRAAGDGDVVRMEEIRVVLRRRGVPAELVPAFAG